MGKYHLANNNVNMFHGFAYVHIKRKPISVCTIWFFIIILLLAKYSIYGFVLNIVCNCFRQHSYSMSLQSAVENQYKQRPKLHPI